MAKAAPAKKDDVIQVVRLRTDTVRVRVVGKTPLYMNSMSAKSRRDLLLPRGRKTTAEKAQTLKHNPLEEYRNSAYRHAGDDQPTRLYLKPEAFKGVLKNAALDMQGATKAQIGRLVWVEGLYVNVYGTPKLRMDVVRSADVGRTPDIRTRAILPEWACELAISYTVPQLTGQTVLDLLAGGGFIIGVGDFRQEKGAGSYGQFEPVSSDDATFRRLAETQGREAQDAALERPEMFDAQTAEDFVWYNDEVSRRGRSASLKVAA